MVAAVTIAAGTLQGTPIAYVIAAATFAAASMVTFLLRFDEWRAKRTPANKLAWGVPQVVFDYTRDSTGEITGVEYVQIAMLLNNTATFGISYIIDEISCSLDGHINQDAKLILKGVVPPLHLQLYRQDRIDMRGSLFKPRAEAKLKFKMRYGRAGHEKYPLDKNSIITCAFDKYMGYAAQIPQDVTQ